MYHLRIPTCRNKNIKNWENSIYNLTTYNHYKQINSQQSHILFLSAFKYNSIEANLKLSY